jgi:hypothetical protein
VEILISLPASHSIQDDYSWRGHRHKGC